MSIHNTDLSPEFYHDLVVAFLADLMTATKDAPTQEAFQYVSQAYFDSLRPWMEPADCPARSRQVFPIFDDCTFDDA